MARKEPAGHVREDLVHWHVSPPPTPPSSTPCRRHSNGLTTEAEALEAATASLSIEAQQRAAKDAQKKAARAEAAQQKQADKLAKSVITIKRIERNKKKFVTAVSGLEAFGLDLKKVRTAQPLLSCTWGVH